MIITFVGHSTVPLRDKVRQAVLTQMRDLISDSEQILCYLGGYGDFDEICASVCKELKSEYKGTELVFVTPYLDLSERRRIKDTVDQKIYDSVLYPPIENVPPKFAISKRNEWMVRNADAVIAFVTHCYGGAYQSLRIADRIGKKIVNVADHLD